MNSTITDRATICCFLGDRVHL